jgi:hypothetical protein
MTVMPRLPDSPAVHAVERLRLALERRGIGARTYGGYGLALLTAGPLIVWCNGHRFWWCTGWDARRRRPVMGSQQASATERTARRVEFHLARLRESRTQQTSRQGP